MEEGESWQEKENRKDDKNGKNRRKKRVKKRKSLREIGDIFALSVCEERKKLEKEGDMYNVIALCLHL